jgi:hypothetical protein
VTHNKINNLVKNMKCLGYSERRIQMMIMGVVGTQDIINLSHQDQIRLIHYLQDCVEYVKVNWAGNKTRASKYSQAR